MKEEGSRWEDRNGGPWTERTRIKGGADEQNRNVPNGGIDIHKGNTDVQDETGFGCKCLCCRKISSGIVWALETIFYK